MSLILSDFFSGTSDLKEVVPSLGASSSLDELNGSAINAKKQICNIITTAIYDTIKSGSNNELKSALSMALANLTMAKNIPFEALKLRKSSVAFYKNEQEASRRMYIEYYFNAMDSLMALLETNDQWKASAFYKRRDALKIKSAAEFDELYPIDQSHFFYFRTIAIQEEILEEELLTYYEQTSEKPSETKRLNRALSMMVVAAAILRFDPIEFPASIRNLFDDSAISRDGDLEQGRLKDVASMILKRASDIIQNVDMILNIKESDESVSSDIQDNRPEDPFYLMT